MNVIWFGNPEKSMYRGWWDMTMLEDFFKDETHFEGIDSAPQNDGAVVVLPARSWGGKEQVVQDALQKLPWVLLIVAGDEEGEFDISVIHHDKLIIWVQNPIPGKHDQYQKLGCGYAPGMNPVFGVPIPKSLDWFFAGQITHDRRQQMVAYLKQMKNGELIETPGFTQGIEPIRYFMKMADAKVAPCPAGPKTPDTFRLFEALELGCVPLADEATPNTERKGFWNWLFGEEVPFPTFTSYKFLPMMMDNAVNLYPVLNNDVQAWWMRKKSDIQQKIFTDARSLGSDKPEEDLTIIVPVSPIKSHPDTSIVEETINNIRFHHKRARIIITFDGVRPEQEAMREDYNEHIRRILWLSHKWGNIYPMIFKEHTHQVGMARVALEKVKTPLILYVEQDTPLVTDEFIEWEMLINTIKSGKSNLVRFHFEAHVPEAHRHLMIGEIEGKLQKTIQWSQRPHLALADFYRQVLKERFSIDAKCFIEDKLHGCVQDDFGIYGISGWDKWKMHIYCPEDRNIKRSYHTDGRGSEKKYDGSQVW